jgi:tRNA1Val (adenine37-N6)-methyltransferase
MELMANTYFDFKRFRVDQDRSAMKVTTDACLFGAWIANEIKALHPDTALDIGTGTGLLSLMVVQHHPDLKIDAIEINPDAAAQAEENIAASPWQDNINVINAGVLEYEFNKEYNIIFSNPPFYEKELKGPDSHRNLAHHEGLSLAQLMGLIKKLLRPQAKFFLLLPYKRNDEIKQLLLHSEFSILKLVIVRQTPAHGYFRLMIMGSADQSVGKTEISEISIMNEQSEYSEYFIQLLQPYYLKL